MNAKVAVLKKTIRRDMQEVAEEASAAAAAENLGLMTELAKRDTRITQLGSRIEDLQVCKQQQRRQQKVWELLRENLAAVFAGFGVHFLLRWIGIRRAKHRCLLFNGRTQSLFLPPPLCCRKRLFILQFID